MSREISKTGLKRAGKIDTVFALLVFCVFAVCALASLMVGAGAYRNGIDQSQARYDERTCLNYIWSKIKNSDSAGGVTSGEFNGIPALIIEETWFDQVYNTYIYGYDGWVMELYGPASFEYDLADGEKILPLDGALHFETLPGGLIKASDEWGEIFISPRSGKAAGI